MFVFILVHLFDNLTQSYNDGTVFIATCIGEDVLLHQENNRL